MKCFRTGFVLVVALSLCSANATAELYLGGQIGGTIPHDFSDVEAGGLASGVTGSDLQLKESLVYGAKVGYFFPTVRWLGVEAEVFHTTPHFKQQPFTASGPGGVGSVELPGSYLSVLTAAFNLIARYPGEMFQPYAGVGVGVFFANAHDAGGSSSDTAPGLNAVAGLRYFLTDRIALFAEYKYNRATFEFNTGSSGIGIQGDYAASHVVGGLTFHFPDHLSR